MNKKLVIIPLLFITTSITLFGCNSSTKSTATHNILKSIELETSDLIEDNTASNVSTSTSESNTSINSDDNNFINIQPIKITNTTSTQNENLTNKKDNTAQANDTINASKEKDSLTYTSQAGFSMNLPKSWNDKYTIEEDSNGLCVIFKSHDPENEGFNSWMISIRKSDTDIIPCFGLAVGNIQNFDADGSHYIVFMPSGLTLDCRRSDYNEYLNMMAECESVINSITITK